MADYRTPIKDMQFVIFDVWQADQFWSSVSVLEEFDRPTAEAVLAEAVKLCEDVVAPLNQPADEHGCTLQAGSVVTPPGFVDAYRVFSDGGWVGLGGNPEFGGMGMPKTLVSAVEEMLQGACMSFGLAPMLTAGACLAIDAHGDTSLKSLYLPKLYSGEWTAAMDLTEAHAGTDLGLIRARAEPNADGSYRVTGTKIFITWGDHDMADNIVHLVLAKLPDAPPGSKGISMFLVPKYLPAEDGSVGEANSLSCGSLEKKMGIKGSATCVMNFDGAKGWLVGGAHQGLAGMFTMMNYERLVVGIQAVGVAHASYHNAVDYAAERLQGRSPTGAKNPQAEADSLLVHPDVRRMLLTMKAYNEGSRAFYVYVAKWLDQAKYGVDAKAREQGDKMVALLTPVAKAFMSDMAFDTTVLGQQIFGGHGYIREWGQEQHVRDVRITQIYEGTNGIQAMDLIGRKTIACKGALLDEFIADIHQFQTDAQDSLEQLKLAQPLQDAVELLKVTTDQLVIRASDKPLEGGAVANDYLHLVGHVTYAYMWAKMACTAAGQPSSDLTEGKLKVADFYFGRLLPQADVLAARVRHGSQTIMALPDALF